MAKNDFDLDFDFEKEYGFDPKSILDSDYNEEDLDLSQFDDEQLSIDLDSGAKSGDEFEDFNLDDLDLDLTGLDLSDVELPDDLKLEEGEPAAPAPKAEMAEEEPAEEEPAGDTFDLDLEELTFDDDEDVDDDFGEDDELMDFTRRVSFFGDIPKQPATEEPAFPQEELPDYEEPAYEEPVHEEPAYEEPSFDPETQDFDYDDDDDDDEDDDFSEEEKPARRRSSGKKREPVQFKMPEIHFTVPPIFMKLYKLYFPSMEEIDPKPEPGKRRRRKSKLQVFKEAYLPAILACVSLVLIFSFMIGSLSNAIERKRQDDTAASIAAQQASQEADRAAAEAEALIAEAQRLAAGYDYQGAINLLDSFTGDAAKYPQVTTMKSEYLSAQNGLVEWKDLSTVPNLSFHVLIHDLTRALADTENGGLYNRNFVTTSEFSKILEQLYKNGYVLVDMDCFVSSNTGLDGTESYYVNSVFLPEGKKPFMLTETLVNYYSYMIDGDNNGVADANGDGFASKLVLDASGSIKAEYVDANGQTQVGNYDLVPILEDFIKAHPDFCYRDSRATLAVSGEQGVFGYRINNTYVSTMGQTYVDEQIAQAKELVAALREKGYTIACYTFGNKNYANINANNIQADMASWASQITPVLGEVNTIVFARESDIGDYSGPKFTTLYQSGMRFFIKNGTEPYAEIAGTYVRQTRLMVTGNTMAWKASMFTDDGLFDPVTVLDPARGNVPN
ncbi:MAG: hypothetical protein IJ001_05605 [Oscillospiraceae bacterium]|nr:hypothetical protein [Oscillospiraceae bacterium]